MKKIAGKRYNGTNIKGKGWKNYASRQKSRDYYIHHAKFKHDLWALLDSDK